jgi:hypothetical protein
MAPVTKKKRLLISSSKATFQLSTPAGEATVDFPESGLYILNVKNDTIIGGYQKYATLMKNAAPLPRRN